MTLQENGPEPSFEPVPFRVAQQGTGRLRKALRPIANGHGTHRVLEFSPLQRDSSSRNE
jgi:hypothetical protein